METATAQLVDVGEVERALTDAEAAWFSAHEALEEASRG